MKFDFPWKAAAAATIGASVAGLMSAPVVAAEKTSQTAASIVNLAALFVGAGIGLMVVGVR